MQSYSASEEPLCGSPIDIECRVQLYQIINGVRRGHSSLPSACVRKDPPRGKRAGGRVPQLCRRPRSKPRHERHCAQSDPYRTPDTERHRITQNHSTHVPSQSTRTSRSLAAPSHLSNLGTVVGRVTCAAASRIAADVGLTSRFVPKVTVIGRSVPGRTVKQGTPKNVVSSCTPPESVITSPAASIKLSI